MRNRTTPAASPASIADACHAVVNVPRKVVGALNEHGRALEWATSFVLLAFAVTLSLPGDTLAGGAAYRGLSDLGLDEAALAMGFTLLATTRLAALYINGAWRRSPLLRGVGAMIGGSIFIMLSVTFGWLWLTDAPSAPDGLGTGTGTYLVLGLFDLLAAYRSGADVRATRPH